MNQQLQNHLVSIITSISDAVKATATFAWDQANDIAYQYVLYGRLKSAIILALGIIIGGILIKISHWAYKQNWQEYSYISEKSSRSGGNIVTVILTGSGGLLVITSSIVNFDLMVWAAPKVWLIQELARMVK